MKTLWTLTIIALLSGFLTPWGVSAFWLCCTLLCLAKAYRTNPADVESIVIYQVMSIVFAMLAITWNL